MQIRSFTTGPGTNAYLVFDEDTREAIVVDAPPEFSQALQETVRESGVEVKQLILTHGHWDHLVDLAELSAVLGAPIVAHRDQTPQLERPGEGRTTLKIEPIKPDEWVTQGDTITVGQARFEVIEFPGHAPGQFGLYEANEKVLFAGDALFKGAPARTDLPGSDASQITTATQRLLDLPDDVRVYSGHGEPTTIGAERQMLRELQDQ